MRHTAQIEQVLSQLATAPFLCDHSTLLSRGCPMRENVLLLLFSSYVVCPRCHSKKGDLAQNRMQSFSFFLSFFFFYFMGCP